MAFRIRMGLPAMAALWQDLSTRKLQGNLDQDEQKFFKKLVKALGYLEQNPRHNSLASHEIDDLTRKYGFKVFQSYLENATPAAGRLFWAYGPEQGDITILAVEPHPESQKRGAYQRLRLSTMPPAKPKPGKRRLSVPATLAPAKPGDQFDATFDAEEDTLVFHRVKRKANWLAVMRKCPVPMDDLPPRSREYPKKLKL